MQTKTLGNGQLSRLVGSAGFLSRMPGNSLVFPLSIRSSLTFVAVLSSCLLPVQYSHADSEIAFGLRHSFMHLPGYEDGYGRGPNFEAVGKPTFEAADRLDSTAFAVNGRYMFEQAWLSGGQLFIQGGAMRTEASDTQDELLTTNADGLAIRFAFLDGSNGFNVSDALPGDAKLRSEIQHEEINLGLGLQFERDDWQIRPQLGPHWINTDLKNTFQIVGQSGTSPTYARVGRLDEQYRGVRFAIGLSKPISGRWKVNANLAYSYLELESDYQASDSRRDDNSGVTDRAEASDSIDTNTYMAAIDVSLDYAFTTMWTVALQLGAQYVNDITRIVQPTGSAASSTFEPTRLETESGVFYLTGIQLKATF
ncbi:MAG: hypothetical protein WED00_00060 [Aquisalimonadaceae bacterium]